MGQATVLFLIVAGSLFSMIAGALAVRRIARLNLHDHQIIIAALVVQAAALFLGTLSLTQSGRSMFDAMLLAASAFGNCGLAPTNLPGPGDFTTHLVILPLTILGGLGLPVLMELRNAAFAQKSLSTHSRTVLTTSAWLYVAGFTLLLALNLLHNGGNLRAAAPASSVLAIESRTGGLDIAPLASAAPAAQWVLILLMAIGASPAGTGGGLKTTTIAHLLTGTQRILKGQSPGRPLGIALTWLGIYLTMAIAAALLLTYLHDIPEGNAGVLFNAVSALSNVGLSVSELPDTPALLYAYSAIMLVGRLTPVLVLWWMAETTRDADVAIG
jgi:trk system potassium uptake protein TrkH